MTRSRKGARDSMYYYKWLDKALCDLQAARILLTWGGDPSNVAFHCQQAIEKALKGYLLFRTGRHYDGHNLTYLCRQAVMADERFTEWLDESAALNNLYIETRYPTDLPLELDESRHPQGIIRRRPPAPDQKIARAVFLKNKKAFPFW